jgi:flagellar basal-body rod modification protein FlgD
MAVTPISSTSLSATNNLQLDDLLRVLLTELTHQDPFKPVDNKDFMAQIAQFASLDSSRQLNDNVVQLLALQALNQSVGLIGKSVSATTATGTFRGRVTAITLADGAPRLTITDGAGQVITNVAIGQLATIQP